MRAQRKQKKNFASAFYAALAVLASLRFKKAFRNPQNETWSTGGELKAES
jgi:hypothetical protein